MTMGENGLIQRVFHNFLFLYKSKYRRKPNDESSSSESTTTTTTTPTSQIESKSNESHSQQSYFKKEFFQASSTSPTLFHKCVLLLQWSEILFMIYTLVFLEVVHATKVGNSNSSINSPMMVTTLQESKNCIPLSESLYTDLRPCHGHGTCFNGTCTCQPGWTGTYCEYCHGKVRLNDGTGFITDGFGNYTSNMKCTWLIESNQNLSNGTLVHAPIYLHIEEFATECGWDHLYIFDGDSVHSPLLSVFSGLLVQDNYKVLRRPEVVAKSGYALLHFYTDVAYNLTGFNITYRTQSCPSSISGEVCSGNGVCVDGGQCTCDAKWTGESCDVEKCPNDCNDHGICDMELHKCQCLQGFKGHDCSQLENSKNGYWEVLTPKSSIPKGLASHIAVTHNNSLWIIGGTNLNLDSKKPPIYRYDYQENVWEKVQGKGAFPILYGHSGVVFENKIYVYGGVHDGRYGTRYVSSSVWAFDLSTRTWSEVTFSRESGGCKRSMCGPIQLAGHSAVVINDKGTKIRHSKSKMVVILGYSPYYGYVNTVQEFLFGGPVWNIVETKGFPISGSFGHTSTWDPYTQKIYVYGGYRIGEIALTNYLHSYDPTLRTWHLLESGPEGRLLHSAVVWKGFMMVFGGNGHNDTTYSLGSKCFTSQVLVYDIGCNSWTSLDPPENIPTDVSRYGHTSVLYNDSVYTWGGFNGIILDDLVRFTPPTCGILSQSDCESSHGLLGLKCEWNLQSQRCELIVSFKEKNMCLEDSVVEGKNTQGICETFAICSACVQNKHDCIWCGNQCQHSDLKCKESKQKAVVALEQCLMDELSCSPYLHTCPLCSSELNCIWNKDVQCIKDTALRNATDIEPVVCERSCSDHTSCYNCTSSSCIWCNNLSTCVDKNAYVISFPFGQCMSWAQSPSLCGSKDLHLNSVSSQCKDVESCDTCLSLPSCGWCDSGSGTGLGRCMEGSSRGPLAVNATSGAFIDFGLCESSLWSFTSCPACQCNGHSSCDEKNACIECEGKTEGDHCEACIPGYYGNAVNGGVCKPCECNGQAESCNSETGRCFCTTKGITGEHCERCDTQSNYAGDPAGGSCFYDLQIDYQFTFNLSKKEDRHYTQINFKNTPSKPDIDADFQITCSILAKINITVKFGGHGEKILLASHNCTTFKTRFPRAEYNFGSFENTTFFVYVYDFRPPLWIQISFSQSPKLDLLHFFITFSTCFLILLIVAAGLWKIKQKYDIYRRRQRLFVEMEQMASRPFAQVYMEIGKTISTNSISSIRRRRKQCPGPIALEPLASSRARAAVLTCIVSLPNGGQSFAPPGMSGICVGSSLIALGNPRKLSFDPISKTDGKHSKLRKSNPSHSLNTCI